MLALQVAGGIRGASYADAHGPETCAADPNPDIGVMEGESMVYESLHQLVLAYLEHLRGRPCYGNKVYTASQWIL